MIGVQTAKDVGDEQIIIIEKKFDTAIVAVFYQGDHRLGNFLGIGSDGKQVGRS